MFTGSYEHTVDNKGRIIIPAKFRDELGEKFIITRGLDGCLFIYPMKQWEEITDQLAKIPSSKEARAMQRFLLSPASETEIDKQGRALIPNSLREDAAITKNVVLVGLLKKIEVWDAERWKLANTIDDMDEVAERMADFNLML